MAFELPPEPQDRVVEVTIPAALDPYFKEWYLATKKTGETPEAFAFRNLALAGLAYRQQKLNDEFLASLQVDADANKLSLDTIVLEAGL